MRRSILVALVALAALAVSAASAKNPFVPAGTWNLQATHASYSGPPTAIRSALANLVRRRVSFSSACTQQPCAVAEVRTAAGRRVRFAMTSTGGDVFTGRVLIGTGLRCGGRALRARLELAASMIMRQLKPADRVVGGTLGSGRQSRRLLTLSELSARHSYDAVRGRSGERLACTDGIHE